MVWGLLGDVIQPTVACVPQIGGEALSSPKKSLKSRYNLIIYQRLVDFRVVGALTSNLCIQRRRTGFQALNLPSDRVISELLLQIGHD